MERQGYLLEVYASDEDDTWTIIFTNPAGTSCPVAEGVGWQVETPVLLGKEPGEET